MNTKTLLFIIGGLIVFAIAFIIFASIGESTRPPVPTPTIAATQPPKVETVRIYSGSVAIKLGNEFAQSNQIPLKAESVSVATFDMCTKYKAEIADGKTVDGIWPGSYLAYLYFIGNCPEAKVKDKEVFFRTYTTVMIRADKYLPDFISYGIAYEQDGHFVYKNGIVSDAMKRQLTYREMFTEQAAILGITYDPAPTGSWHDLKVNIAYTDPTKSGGGMEYLMMLCNYYANPSGTDICQTNSADFPGLVDLLVANKQNQPMQDPSSPSWFDQWRAYTTTYPLGASSESLYIGWYNKLPADQKIPAGMNIPTDGKWPTGTWPQGAKIVPLYPEWTVATDHPLVCFTDTCMKYLKMYREQQALQEQGAAALGMRTATVGIGNKPSGAADLSTIVGEWQVMPSNTYEVLQSVMDALKR